MNKPQENSSPFYFDENGLAVFTEQYLLKMGSCCGNGCKHCPYEYINVPEPKRAELLKNKTLNEDETEGK